MKWKQKVNAMAAEQMQIACIIAIIKLNICHLRTTVLVLDDNSHSSNISSKN
jgi:hypothetical protein